MPSTGSTLSQTLVTGIIIAILFYLFYQAYIKLTQPPQDTTNPDDNLPDNSQTPGGGNVASPGNALDYAPTPTSSTNPLSGILLMVAMIVGDLLSRKLKDLAEKERERQRRINEEKERQMKAKEEKARDERRRILQDELSSEDSKVRERAREELKRQLDASDERGRVERDRLINDLSSPDESVRSRAKEEFDRQMRAKEERGRVERDRLINDLSSPDTSVRAKATEELKKQLGANEERGRVERDRLFNDLSSPDTSVRMSATDELKKQMRAKEERGRVERERFLSQVTGDFSNLPKPKPESVSIILEEAVYGQPQRTTDKTERINPDHTKRRPMGTVDLMGAAGGKLPPKSIQTNPSIMKALGKKLSTMVIGVKATNAIGRAGGYLADSLAGRILANGLEKSMVALDVLTIASLFSDSGFYGQFPDESSLLTWDNVQQYTAYSLTSQFQVLQSYNSGINRTNTTMDGAPNARDDGYPYAPALFPLINGPLDSVDINLPGQFNGDVYYNKIRIQTEVDAVQERILRDSSTVYSQALKNAFNVQLPCGQNWATITADTTQSLVSYLNLSSPCPSTYPASLLPANMIDTLYERAYTVVCNKYNGVVYKDYYPKSDKYRPGRQRLQCGYANAAACNQNAVDYYRDLTSGISHGGSYAEWHIFSDVLTNTGVMPTNLITLASQLAVINAGTQQDYSNVQNLVSLAANSFTTYSQAGHSGACIVKNPALLSLCATPIDDPNYKERFDKNTTNPYQYNPTTNTTTLPSKGMYNFTTHRCQFSPAYCQLIGTCYGVDTQLCALPDKAMEAMSFFFGSGGPRAYIKAYGCTYTGPYCTGVTGLDKFNTASGKKFADSLVDTNKHWGEGLKHTFSDASNDLMLVMSVASLVAMTATAEAIIIPGTVGLAAAVDAATIAMATTLGVAETAAELAAVGAATGPVGITLAAAAGMVALGAAIAAGVLAAVTATDANWDARSSPTTDPNEYTIGGWLNDANGNKTPKAVSWASGWVTKPLLYHPPGQLNNPYTSVDAFPASVLYTRSEFGTQTQGSDLRAMLSTCCNGGCGVAKINKCPKQYKCHEEGGRIRAGSDNDQNRIWCLKPYPIVSADTDVHDPAIGPLSNAVTEFLWSNIWTDGSNPYLPQYPQNYSSAGNHHHGWYYQLSYDPEKILPSAVTNTTLLQKYFDDTTIGQIRSYYCQSKFYTNINDGTDVSTIDTWCWGYLNISVVNYIFNPMSLVGN